ncbi:MAG TPA: preprotein translocase subunit YajC [Vicinamibacterales bacterium]|nr:preprotein translocase subunit YajC [Vicinamibacterales bacterium]
MTDLMPVPFFIAQTAAPAPNIWVQLFPFALMLLIFYLLVLMPMRKRQKKVAEFQSSLKAGDKVITTGGVYGEVTRVDDQAQTVQVQIADRVRITVARASIGGYQGAEPVVKSDSSGGM